MLFSFKSRITVLAMLVLLSWATVLDFLAKWELLVHSGRIGIECSVVSWWWEKWRNVWTALMEGPDFKSAKVFRCVHTCAREWMCRQEGNLSCRSLGVFHSILCLETNFSLIGYQASGVPLPLPSWCWITRDTPPQPTFKMWVLGIEFKSPPYPTSTLPPEPSLQTSSSLWQNPCFPSKPFLTEEE